MVTASAVTSPASTQLVRAAARLVPAVAGVQRHYRHRLAAAVKSHASGRAAGPEIITGEYVDSIGVRDEFVGTDDPRGGRLEFGYQGDVDQHGPYPHFQPAIDEVRPQFVLSMQRLVAEVLE